MTSLSSPHRDPASPGGARGGLRRAGGGHHPGERWLGPLTPADERALDRVLGHALDVGCGPARHTLGLARRGIPTLGIDITPCLLDLARPTGAPVLHRDVFERVPAEGRWHTVLLLDGNIGIGGDACALLRRAELLAPGGQVLAELDPPGTAAPVDEVRVEVGGRRGPWFAWDRVTPERLDTLLLGLPLRLHERWVDEDRWFVDLRLPTHPAGDQPGEPR